MTMRPVRLATAVTASVIAVAAITACGTASSNNEAIATVGGQTITKAMFDHWFGIEAVIVHEAIPGPQQPIPAGEIPDPPNYTACAKFLRAIGPPDTNKSERLTIPQLKARCKQLHENLRLYVLRALISSVQVNAEAKAQKIAVTSQEVKQAFARWKHERFASQSIFQRFSTYSGETATDIELLIRVGLQSHRLEERLRQHGGLAHAREFNRQSASRWINQTSCSPGYVVPGCKQYKH